jgi:hypothetical protein
MIMIMMIIIIIIVIIISVSMQEENKHLQVRVRTLPCLLQAFATGNDSCYGITGKLWLFWRSIGGKETATEGQYSTLKGSKEAKPSKANAGCLVKPDAW